MDRFRKDCHSIDMPLPFPYYLLVGLLSSIGIYLVFVLGLMAIRGSIAKKLGKKTVPFDRILDKPTATVMILGDSTSIGTGASRAHLSVAGRLATDFPTITVVNNGMNGISTGDLSRMLTDHPEWRADLVVIHISGIDVLGFRSLRGCGRNISAIIGKAQAISPRIILLTSSNLGTIPFSRFPFSDIFSRRTKLVRRFVLRRLKRGGFAFVDLYDEPESDPLLADPKKFFADDGIHPSDSGYGIWYDRLRKVISETGWDAVLGHRAHSR